MITSQKGVSLAYRTAFGGPGEALSTPSISDSCVQGNIGRQNAVGHIYCGDGDSTERIF